MTDTPVDTPEPEERPEMTTITVEVTEWDLEYEVSIEMDDGVILTGIGKTLVDALRVLADRVAAR
jgi:hypothetical protein